MKFLNLLAKEIKAIKLQGIIFAVVQIFFGSTSIALQKFLPKFIPEGMAEMFEPSLMGGLADYVENSLQLGGIVVILITIGAVAGEREANTLELLLTRPVSRLQIIWAKYLARFFYILVGTLIAALVAWYYAVYLFEPFSLSKLMLSAVTIAAVLAFISSLTMVFSALVGSRITAFLLSGGLTLVLAILSTFKPPIKYFSPFKYGKAANRALLGAITPGAYLLDLLLFIGFIALALGTSVFLLKKVEKIS